MVKERVVLGIGYSKYNFMCVVSVMVKVKYVLFKNKNLFEMWWRCLKKGYISFFLRFLEVIVLNRYVFMIKERVGKFFFVFGKVLNENNLQLEYIWNMDEIGFILVYKLGKVVVEKGVKIVYVKCFIQ